MNFISIRVRTAFVVHGFDSEQREILEQAQEEQFVEKIVAISRVQSITEKYILVTSAFGRAVYWEYEGGMEQLRERLSRAGLLVR